MNSKTDEVFRKSLMLLPLLLGVFLVTSGLAFSSTLLPDIASSFEVSIGTASTLGLAVNLVGLIVGLFMGVLMIRFKQKPLFLFGLIMCAVGELGMFFSPTFGLALIATLFTGIGRAVVLITILSLIGGLFPLEKRGWAIGLVTSASFFALVFAPFLSVSIAHFAGWRSVLVLLMLPIAIVSLVLGFLAIPSKVSRDQPLVKSSYSEAYRQVLLNRSAVACLVVTTLLTLAASVAGYAVSFYRIDFAVPQVAAGVFASFVAVGGVFGGIGGGRLLNRTGRKRLAVVAGFVAGLSVLSFTFMPNLWLSLALWAVSATAAAIAWVGLRSLTLEQVPAFRGSMMSMYQTFEYIGAIIGVIIGTLVLNLYANNFQLLMVIFGASGIAAAPILLLLAKDPSNNP